MPLRRKPNGKWTFAEKGHPEYASEATAKRAYQAYLAKKHESKPKRTRTGFGANKK